MGYILAGTLNMRMLNQSTGDVILTSKTLQENSLSISVTAEDIRGGLSNPLIGKYFHDSVMDANITDAVFSLEYLSTVVGGNITTGVDVIQQEEITTTTANEITVTDTPADFLGLGNIGWYTIMGEDNWIKITINSVTKKATVSDLAVGSKVCVRYCSLNSSAREFTVSSAIIPDEVILEIEAPLFQANAQSFTESSRVGKLVVTIPRFLLSGTTDLTMTSSSASTTNLSGSAMASFGTATSCSDLGVYGKVQEIIFNKAWYEGLTAMAVASGADIQLAVAGTETLNVVGIFNNSTGTIANSNLTFTSADSTKATVSNAGVVTGVANGSTTISIVATGKPTITAEAKVTVS